jgi:hypothetical protein
MLRRDLLICLGAGLLGGALCAGEAEAAGAKRIVAVESSSLGTTFQLSLASAPFPFRGSEHSDSTVLVFVPLQVRLGKSKKIEVVVHFHGHNTTAKKAIEAHKLREQLRASRQSAVLVVPQGPVNAADGDFGKLMQKGGLSHLLEEVRDVLQSERAEKALGKASLAGAKGIGRVVVSGHSGGYRPAAAVVRHGGVDIREVYLFDALYGDVDAFEKFALAEKNHKIVSYYVGGVPREKSLELANKLANEGVLVKRESGDKRLTREELVKGRACFLSGKATHATATYEEQALRDCLLASCLVGRGSKAWHADKQQPRAT